MAVLEFGQMVAGGGGGHAAVLARLTLYNVVALLLGGEVAIATPNRLGQSMLTLCGMGLALVNTCATAYAPGPLLELVFLVLLLWLLGLVHGFTRRRVAQIDL